MFVGKTGPHIPSSSWAAHNTGETSGESPSQHGGVRSESTNQSPTRPRRRCRRLPPFPRQRLLQLSTTQLHRKILQKFLWGIQKSQVSKRKGTHGFLLPSADGNMRRLFFRDLRSHLCVGNQIYCSAQTKSTKRSRHGGGGHVRGWRTAEGAGRVRSSLLRGNLWSYEMTQIYKYMNINHHNSVYTVAIRANMAAEQLAV